MTQWPNGGKTSPVPSSKASSGFRSTSLFGTRTNPVTGIKGTAHNGIDLIGFSAIKAPAAGTVTFSGYNGTAGYEVRIRIDGPNAFTKGAIVRLLHNSKLLVKTGQRVTEGQQVAVMGSTGQSTGPHCHFEVRPGGGNPVDPLTWMPKALAADGGGTPASGGWPAKAKKLRVGSNKRSAPTTASKIEGFAPAGSTLQIDTFRRGQKVTVGGVTSDIWFGIKGSGTGRPDGIYVSATCFEDRSTAGLKQNSDYKVAPAKKRYARLADSWYFYYKAGDKPRRDRMLVPGDYELVTQSDTKSPYVVKSKYGNVIIGTVNTSPKIITK